MARTQFTFTFTNAQPGSVVSFDGHVTDRLYAAASGSARLGHPLILNSTNSISVWADVAELTATTEDGAGNDISATATISAPTVTTADGTPGQNPFGAASGATKITGLSASSSAAAVDGSGNINDFFTDAQRGTDATCDGTTFTVGPGVYECLILVQAGTHSASGRDLVSGGIGTTGLGNDVGSTVSVAPNGDWLQRSLTSIDTPWTFVVKLANDVAAVSWVGVDIVRLGDVADPT